MLNRKAMSLISAVVATAIISLSSMALIQMLNQGFKGQRMLASNVEVNGFSDLVRFALSDSNTCTDALGTKTFNHATLGTAVITGISLHQLHHSETWSSCSRRPPPNCVWTERADYLISYTELFEG